MQYIIIIYNIFKYVNRTRIINTYIHPTSHIFMAANNMVGRSENVHAQMHANSPYFGSLRIYSDILFGIYSDILSGIYSDILSNILSDISSKILCGRESAGPL